MPKKVQARGQTLANHARRTRQELSSAERALARRAAVTRKQGFGSPTDAPNVTRPTPVSTLFSHPASISTPFTLLLIPSFIQLTDAPTALFSRKTRSPVAMSASAITMDRRFSLLSLRRILAMCWWA
jgi:hypothetical protein